MRAPPLSISGCVLGSQAEYVLFDQSCRATSSTRFCGESYIRESLALSDGLTESFPHEIRTCLTLFLPGSHTRTEWCLLYILLYPYCAVNYDALVQMAVAGTRTSQLIPSASSSAAPTNSALLHWKPSMPNSYEDHDRSSLSRLSVGRENGSDGA